MWETWVQSLSWEEPLEKGMATHSGILIWRIPWTEYWSGLPFPSPEDLPNPEIKTASLESPALAGGFLSTVPPGEPPLALLLLFSR